MGQTVLSDYSSVDYKFLLMLEKSISHPRKLVRHADSVETETTEILANCYYQAANTLSLSFTVRSRIENIILPDRRNGNRVDRLWETTCFELFIQRNDATAYSEINLSPSTDWAIFQLDGYRKNRRDDLDAAISGTKVQLSNDRLSISTRITLPLFTRSACEDYRIGLASIIEDRTGAKSFWALTHPPGAPDFHHADCFIGAIMENQTQ